MSEPHDSTASNESEAPDVGGPGVEAPDVKAADTKAAASEVPIDPQTAAFAGKMFDLARSGESSALAAYIDAGVPVGLTNAAGDSLLMLAAYHEQPDCVRVLLDRGAPVDAVNDRGQTPLAGAVFKGNDVIVDLLLGAGADPWAAGASAWTAAHVFGRDDYVAGFTAAREATES